MTVSLGAQCEQGQKPSSPVQQTTGAGLRVTRLVMCPLQAITWTTTGLVSVNQLKDCS